MSLWKQILMIPLPAHCQTHVFRRCISVFIVMKSFLQLWDMFAQTDTTASGSHTSHTCTFTTYHSSSSSIYLLSHSGSVFNLHLVQWFYILYLIIIIIIIFFVFVCVILMTGVWQRTDITLGLRTVQFRSVRIQIWQTVRNTWSVILQYVLTVRSLFLLWNHWVHLKSLYCRSSSVRLALRCRDVFAAAWSTLSPKMFFICSTTTPQPHTAINNLVGNPKRKCVLWVG